MLAGWEKGGANFDIKKREAEKCSASLVFKIKNLIML